MSSRGVVVVSALVVALMVVACRAHEPAQPADAYADIPMQATAKSVGQVIAELPGPARASPPSGGAAPTNDVGAGVTSDVAEAAPPPIRAGSSSIVTAPTPSASNARVNLSRMALAHVSKETLDQVVARYEQVLPAVTDEDVRLRVSKRVADLKLERQSLDLDRADYAGVIADYEKMLNAPASPQVRNALAVAIRYQLARARDLAGQSDQAIHDLDALVKDTDVMASTGDQRVFAQEAMFRRAESSFVKGEYRSAAVDYAVAAEVESPYRLHASYMLGWARFKTQENDAALEAFFSVIEQLSSNRSADQLLGSERELLADTLRASVLCFERGNGVSVLAAAMRKRQLPAWQNVVYVALGKYYLDHQRYADAARTFTKYEDENALAADAPAFALRAIDAMFAGGFPKDAEALQPKFVERYSRGTAFHKAVGDEGLAPLHDRMREFIDRLASAEHAAAQARNERAHYLQAAHWYRAWLTNFDVQSAAGDATAASAAVNRDIGERLFLLGEVLMASGQSAEAVPVYRAVVIRMPEHPRAREAGYAVVLALADMARTDPKQAPVLLAAELEFANFFAADPRAPEVALHAARSLLDTADHSGAATTAEHALSQWSLSKPQSAVAEQIAGEARFALGELPAAEDHFLRARDLASNAVERKRWQERLIATVGKQAEQHQATGKVAEAIADLRRIAKLDPGSKVATTSLLNVAALLVQSDDLAGAASELEALRKAYPQDPQVAEVPLRLADLYERLRKPVLAADELRLVAAATNDLEQARTARYHAAELYLAGKADASAGQALREYVGKYPRPVVVAAEAVHHLRELAHANKDLVAQHRWAAQQMELQDHAEKDGNDRTRFLAAEASVEIAGELRNSYEAIALRQPLGVTLRNKRAALDAAVAAYERAGAYGVQQFLTAATWRIAGMYERLAAEVSASERPKGLTPDGMAQYETELNTRAQSFVARAVELHRINAVRAKEGVWDESVAASYAALATIAPLAYARKEIDVAPDTSAPDASLAAKPAVRAALDSAVAQHAAGELATSLASLQQISAAAPRCDIEVFRGLIERKLGKFAAAEASYQQCLAREPTNGNAWRNLGVLYEIYMDKPEQALEAYKHCQAAQATPDPEVAAWIVKLTSSRIVSAAP